MHYFWDNIERTSSFINKVCKNKGYYKKVAFMHIPKCAGISVMEALRRNRKSSWQGHIDGPETRSQYMQHLCSSYEEIDFIKHEQQIYRHHQSILVDYLARGYPIINGHVPFLASLKEAYPQYFTFI